MQSRRRAPGTPGQERATNESMADAEAKKALTTEVVAVKQRYKRATCRKTISA